MPVERRVTKPEFLDRLWAEIPRLQILAGGGCLGRRLQTRIKLVLGPLQDVEQFFPRRLAIGSAVGPIPAAPRHLEAGPRRQQFERVVEADVFDLLHEGKAIAPLAARPALIRLSIGIDAQRGVVIVVKRAQARELAAAASRLQGDTLADQLRDVGPGADKFLEIGSNARRHARLLICRIAAERLGS